MRVKLLVATVFMALSILLTTQSVIADGWVDQWMSHKLVASPVIIHEESRTYGSLGGVSMRWPTPQDEPYVTFAAPRISAGCGGIDLFFGGMSYVDVKDFFQKKLEMLVNSMPAIGLQLALAVFNEPLKNVIQSVQAATDWINGLQIDDCSMIQGIVNKGMDTDTFKSLQGGVEAGYEIAKRGIATSVNDGWGAFKQQFAQQPAGLAARDATGAATAQQAAAALVSGCPAIIQKLASTQSALVTMMEEAGYTSANGYNPNQIADIGRALVGDYYTLEPGNLSDDAASATNIKVIPRDPHLGESKNFYNAILTGQLKKKAIANSSGSSVAQPTNFQGPSGTTYTSIQQFVNTNINSIMSHLSGNTAIAPGSDEEFLATTVPNTYTLCKALSMMGASDPTLVKTMAENEFVYAIINDLSKVIGSGVVALSDRLISAGKAEDTSCGSTVFLKDALGYTGNMKNNIEEVHEMTAGIYFAKLDQCTKILNNYQIIRSIYGTLVSEGRKAFNDSVMERLTGTGRGV